MHFFTEEHSCLSLLPRKVRIRIFLERVLLWD